MRYLQKSSKQLDSHWTTAGNKAETHFGQGGHCQIHSFAEIVDCLDDGCVAIPCDVHHMSTHASKLWSTRWLTTPRMPSVLT